jgi:hypothetical protein
MEPGSVAVGRGKFFFIIGVGVNAADNQIANYIHLKSLNNPPDRDCDGRVLVLPHFVER